MEESPKIFSQFINIKNNKLIVSEEPICNEKIKNYNKEIKKGIKADLLIYPILEKRISKNLNETVLYKECAIDLETQRPIISMLSIDIDIKLNRKKESYIFFRDVIHAITHILGFHKIHLKAKGLLKNFLRVNFYSLKNINEKENNLWYPLKISLPNYDFTIKNDIMSSLPLQRILTFSSQTLAILQKLNWYQINLSSCDLSLNGDFDYLRHTIAISIVKNKNNDYSLHCYLKNNLKKKCTVLNSTFITRKIPKKINTNEYSNYFDGNHHLNRFLIWDKSIPKRKKPQIINLLSPKKNGKCKNPQRTIFVRYPEELNLTNPELENYKLEQYTIKNPNMTVYHSYLRDVDIPPFYKLMKFNNIPFNTNYFLSNFLSSFFNVQKLPEVLNSLGKYQIYSNIPNSSYYLGNKAALFRNYRKLKNKFPKDFEFHPESFLLSEDREILRERFKDYIQTKDDLWVNKPPGGTLGLGIKLMKNGEDFLRHSFINRYISNPHLLHGRKYHIRMYVVVSGILPLKIYVFDEGQVMIASDKYYYNLDQIENPTSMLTNGHVNFNQPGYNTNITLDTEEGNEWTIKTLSKHIEKEGGNWTKIWEEIKDLSIKTILLGYGETQKIMIEEYPNLRKNNIIHRYGFDIMIDSNFKPWLLEVNTKPAMELYNIINVYNKLRVEADRVNLVGMIPFDH